MKEGMGRTRQGRISRLQELTREASVLGGHSLRKRFSSHRADAPPLALGDDGPGPMRLRRDTSPPP